MAFEDARRPEFHDPDELAEATQAEQASAEQRRRAAAAAAGTAAAVGAGGQAAQAAGEVPAAAARATAAGAILSALVAFLATQRARMRSWLTEQLRKRTPAASPDDIAKVIADEERRGEEFEKRSATRFARDITTALAIPDPASRAAAIRGLTSREQRYARQRDEAMAARAFAAVDRVVLREQSPQGAFWRLDPTVVEHTAGCLIMGGKFWPWPVLDRVHPPRHAGCPCRLLGYGDAIADGYMAPGAVQDVKSAIRRAASVVMEGAVALEAEDADALIEEAGGRELLELRTALIEQGMTTEDQFDALEEGYNPAQPRDQFGRWRDILHATEKAPALTRVASGDYEAAGGRVVVQKLPDVRPPAWNAELRDPGGEGGDELVVDGAASLKDARASLDAFWRQFEVRAEPLPAGAQRDQYNGRTLVRRVAVVSDEGGAMVKVRALNGPLAGSEYEVARDALRGNVEEAEEVEEAFDEGDRPRDWRGRWRRTGMAKKVAQDAAKSWALADDDVRLGAQREEKPGWPEGATDAQKRALREYTGKSKAVDLNRKLREGEDLTPEEQQLVRDLDSAIRTAGSYPADVYVWRGITAPDRVIPRGAEMAGRSREEREKLTNEAVARWAREEFVAGEPYVPPRQFHSTSFGVEAPLAGSLAGDHEGVVFEIRTRSGAPLFGDLTQHDDEDELLLGRDARFVVVGVLDEVSFETLTREVTRTVVQLVEVG